MTTADVGVDPRTGAAALGARWAALRHAMSRPLTAYYLLLGSTALLLTIGLIMVLSASSVWSFKEYDGDSYAVVKRQLTWVLIGVPAALLASRLPIRLIRALAWPGLIVAAVLLALTTTSLGVTRNSQTNWLALGPVDVQPSEIAKLAVILWAAHVYANKDRLLGSVHHILVPVLPGLMVIIGLVLWQRDLGTALVLFAIGLAMLWIVGTPGKLFGLALSTVGVLVFTLAASDQERLSRLTSFTDPFRDYADSGWQSAHGLLALSSGGVFGEGIGAGRQKWGTLPEAHTDFIFAVLGEELGLAGTLLVVVLFLAVAYSATKIALQATDPFVRYASFGIVVWLLGQMMINVGMVLALLPVIGIPLPLVSYGGSALVPSLVALGLVIGFARRQPDVARALAARKRPRAVGLSARGAR